MEERNRIDIEHRLTSVEQRLDALAESIFVQLDLLSQQVDHIEQNSQRHVQWLLRLLTGTLVTIGVSWILRLLGWI